MFRINQRSTRPIYEQILESVEDMVMRGVILKDEQLPSVRAVAGDLAVNPNTIQKAYALLEERGIIYSRPGRGSFVAVSGEELQARRVPQAMAVLDEAVDALSALAVPPGDIVAHVTAHLEQEERGETHDYD